MLCEQGNQLVCRSAQGRERLTLFVMERVVQPDNEGIWSVASASFEHRLLRPSVRQLAVRENLRVFR